MNKTQIRAQRARGSADGVVAVPLASRLCDSSLRRSTAGKNKGLKQADLLLNKSPHELVWAYKSRILNQP